MQQQQPRIDKVNHDVSSLRGLVEKSRPGAARHHDLDAMEKEVNDLTDRWDRVRSQINERSVSVVFCEDQVLFLLKLSYYEEGF